MIQVINCSEEILPELERQLLEAVKAYILAIESESGNPTNSSLEGRRKILAAGVQLRALGRKWYDAQKSKRSKRIHAKK